MASATAQKESELASDVRMLRVLFTLVPWRMRWRVIFLAVAAAVTAGLDMIAVAAMLPLTQLLTSPFGDIPGPIRDYVVPVVGTDDRQALLFWVAGFVAGAFITKNLATIVIRWLSIGVSQKASAEAQTTLLRRYAQSTYTAQLRRSKADVLQVVSAGVPAAFTAILLGYISIVVDGLTIVLLVATIAVLSPLSALAAVVIFGGSALLVSRVLKPWNLRFGVRAYYKGVESWRYLNPTIEGFRETRIFGKERLFTDAYHENRREVARLNQRTVILSELPKYLLEIVMIVGIVTVAAVLFATSSEGTAFGLLAVFGAATMRIIPALNRAVGTLGILRGGRVSLRTVVEEVRSLEQDLAGSRSRDEQLIDIPHDDIVVTDLSYRYPGTDKDVLRDVTVTIPRGRTVALVGSSGAGKTTFADILTGLLEPTGGSVTVAGVDLAEHPRSWLANVATVSQRVYVWEAPLRDLITFGEPSDMVDEERLQDVLRRARLESVVAEMPDGLDTVVGEGGTRLSGGQVQRVGIARALYARADVLILDEATSALDNETEHEITATIEELGGDMTVIVIAHRLSTVKNADEILFFSQGTLRASGTMRELRDREPEFERLVQLGTLVLD